MLLSSAYGFSQEAAKTSDHYFTGFPSYWNIVVFYLVVLAAPPLVNAAVLIGAGRPGVRADRLRVPLAHADAARAHDRAGPRMGGAGAGDDLAVSRMCRGRCSTCRSCFPCYYLVLSLVLDARRRAAGAGR